MNAESLFMVSGVGLGLMIIAALLTKKNTNQRANRMLAGSLACSISYLTGLVMVHNQWLSGSPLPTVLVFMYFAGAPLMFGYVKILTEPHYVLSTRQLLHLLPAATLLALALFVLPGSLRPNQETLEMARSGWPPSPIAILSVLMYATSIIYMSLALKLVNAHEVRVTNTFSYEERSALRWLQVFITVCLALRVVGLVLGLLRWIPGIELWPRTLYSSSMIIAIYYLIAFIEISQSEIKPTDRPSGDENTNVLSASRYETSALTPSDIADYWVTIQALMSEQKPYLNNKLRIADLADLADIPAHHLSQVINQQAGRNFFDFINHYRVEAAKVLMTEEQPSMTHIAFEAGFNSQSAFYRQFKKDIGQTPRQYQRQLPNSAS